MQTQTSFLMRFWLIILIICTLAACRPTDKKPIPETVTPEIPAEISSQWWTPQPGQSLHIQYEGEVDLSASVEIFNLDLFETTPVDIQYLHARNIKVICYLNAGGWEDWRPDRDSFPKDIIGKKYQGWPGEYWLDIRQFDALESILGARLDLCEDKGFDGVEPDNVDGFQNQTGFPLTYEDQLRFNRWLAEEAHKRGLGIGLKNDPDQASELVTDFDWITTENCFEEDWCELVTAFIQAGKPVFAIEYTSNMEAFNEYCNASFAEYSTIIQKNRSLDAWQETCP